MTTEVKLVLPRQEDPITQSPGHLRHSAHRCLLAYPLASVDFPCRATKAISRSGIFIPNAAESPPSARPANDCVPAATAEPSSPLQQPSAEGRLSKGSCGVFGSEIAFWQSV